MSSSIFDWLSLVAQNIWLYGGGFMLVLGILVFVHEMGHYLVARWCGVRIDSFSIGFGKELFGFTDKRGTRWKFSLVPLGGYVKMFGDVDPASAGHSETVGEGAAARPLTAQERSVAFFSQSVGKRALIVVAGPAINFLFAIIVLAGLFMFYGQPVTPSVAVGVIGGSAADKAGFEPHDQILAMDDTPIHRFEDIKREVMIGLDRERAVKIKRGDETIVINVTPMRSVETDHFGFKHTRGMLGIIGPANAVDLSSIDKIDGQTVNGDADKARALLKNRMGRPVKLEMKKPELAAGDKPVEKPVDNTNILIVHPLPELNKDLLDPQGKNYGRLNIATGVETQDLIKHNPISAVVEAVNETVDISVSTLEALGQMIVGSRSATELGGIIRIGAMAGDMAKTGFVALITFTALLSINLGLVNLFPIPMLDGGHLVFYAVESVKGSPIPERIQEYAFRFGLVILVGIMLFANLNDLLQLFL